MDSSRLLDGLSVEVARLREVAARDLAAAVPTCPGWTVSDLVRHVAGGCLNVVVRRLRGPENWPVQELSGERPIAALDRGWAALSAEFRSRAPADPVGQGGQETVAFWIRRMAHEIAVHRVDAELALGEAISPIPDERAADGVAELLAVFLEHQTRAYPQDYRADLIDWGDRSVLVSAGSQEWQITLRPDGAQVRAGGGRAQASIGGDPTAVLLWLYNRGGHDDIVLAGDAEMIAQLARLLTAATGST
jgi:uncharacterized protein (TIGR03083 family)